MVINWSIVLHIVPSDREYDFVIDFCSVGGVVLVLRCWSCTTSISELFGVGFILYLELILWIISCLYSEL